MSILLRFFELFRFIQHARDRKAAQRQAEREERQAEREHQRLILEAIFSKMVESQKVQADSVMALAQAQQASAAVLTDWLKGFHISDPSPQPPSVVTPQQEWMREQERLVALGLPMDAIDNLDLPPEFRLAFDLRNTSDLAAQNNAINEAEGFDREGS